MTEIRLIDANALKEHFAYITNQKFKATVDNSDDWATFTEKEIEDIIDKAPTIPSPDFKEGYKQAIIDGKTNFSRPQGEWTNKHFEHADCSVCGRTNDYHGDFCKYCGADMRGEKE